MSKQEKIVCAAIYVMSVKDGYEGTHIVKGVNYEEINKDGLLSEISHPTFCNMFIRGFVTNKNRFVDPVKAMKIAIEARQFEYLVFKDLEVRLLKQQKFDTQAKISERLVKEWIDIVSERGLEPEDLY